MLVDQNWLCRYPRPNVAIIDNGSEFSSEFLGLYVYSIFNVHAVKHYKLAELGRAPSENRVSNPYHACPRLPAISCNLSDFQYYADQLSTIMQYTCFILCSDEINILFLFL